MKVIDPKSKTCTTLAGTGEVGHANGPFEKSQFSEPSGLCVGPEGKTLLVADTNNHMIRVIDLELRDVSEVSVYPPGARQLPTSVPPPCSSWPQAMNTVVCRLLLFSVTYVLCVLLVVLFVDEHASHSCVVAVARWNSHLAV